LLHVLKGNYEIRQKGSVTHSVTSVVSSALASAADATLEIFKKNKMEFIGNIVDQWLRKKE
jgi:hypothetical protein